MAGCHRLRRRPPGTRRQAPVRLPALLLPPPRHQTLQLHRLPLRLRRRRLHRLPLPRLRRTLSRLRRRTLPTPSPPRKPPRCSLRRRLPGIRTQARPRILALLRRDPQQPHGRSPPRGSRASHSGNGSRRPHRPPHHPLPARRPPRHLPGRRLPLPLRHGRHRRRPPPRHRRPPRPPLAPARLPLRRRPQGPAGIRFRRPLPRLHRQRRSSRNPKPRRLPRHLLGLLRNA